MERLELKVDCEDLFLETLEIHIFISFSLTPIQYLSLLS